LSESVYIKTMASCFVSSMLSVSASQLKFAAWRVFGLFHVHLGALLLLC